ncbi:glycosyl hydrolase family 3 protein [Bifidobacterium moukalabense DSM 27321]|uniref:Glycosyl hydrolase family 3 protein n=1 Tax=Bifidobacterium moukalabense DSM 27321 TaxID=1435051 RepID=W4N6L5_9BIFI|nr:glycosyl hydrolase family 3 protein [Bifidobacterium moukalabense DSM 27321]
MKRNPSSRVWRGVTTTFAALLALSLTATSAVQGFRTDINKFLGTTSTRFVSDEGVDAGETYTYKSDYSNTTELVQSIRDLGERVSEEGSVLLKNDGALPLGGDETKRVSLLGFSSYYPVQGGDMGSVVSQNEGTDADTVDMVTAFKEKGFSINETLQSLYESMKDDFSTEINNFGQKTTVNRITAPMIGEKFSGKEPSQDQMNKASSDWKSSLNDNNVMIVTIARASGENRAYMPGQDGVDGQDGQSDPLGLTDNERALIDAAVQAKKSNGGKVIVLINSANTMQIQEVADNAGVDAIMQIGLPGAYGFYGVADLLSGDANPSGHLSDTWVSNNASSPAVNNYGDYEWTNADTAHTINSEIVQAEGIYTGYKYYETRYFDERLGQGNASSTVGSTDGGSWNYGNEVTYPFGYGLSYTTFSQKLDSVDVDLAAKTVTAKVTVTNTGDVSGKSVVQLYDNVPYTDYDKSHDVEKPAVQLLDYAKTKELKPGESQTLTITADAQYMASWDSTAENSKGTKGTYILDAGEYVFTIADNAHDAANNVLARQGASTDGNADNTASWTLDGLDSTTFAVTKNGTKVENQLQDADLNTWMPDTVTYLSRSDWQGTWPKTYKDLTATDEMLKGGLTNDTYEITSNGDTSSVTWGADGDLNLATLKGVDIDDSRWDDLINQMDLSEALIRTAFGGTSTKAIESITSPEVIQNDGPNGFASYTLGQYANTDKSSGDPYAVDADDKNLSYSMGVMASETVLGQTFSKDLAEEWGKAIGNYSIWANTTILWGVGTNLHRTAYNARNHEYYSEDPVLTGFQAAASISGAKAYGCILAPKHYAFNDTEINRTGVATFMTEQKAREGELRAHQSPVEDAGTLGMMSGYNRIGVTSTNASTGLMLGILRNEWGFKGILSEDFIMDNEYQNLRAAAYNGVTMLTSTGDDSMDAVAKLWPYWTVDNVRQDTKLMKALHQNMKWQNYAYANSNAVDGLNSTTRIEHVRTWYDNALTGVSVVTGLLTLLGAVMYVVSRRGRSERQ